MSGLVPSTPFTITASVALFASCLMAWWRDRSSLPIIAIMLWNWIGTRAVSAFDLSAADQAVIDLTSAAALIAAREGREIVALPVAALFATMVSFSFLNHFGLISRDTLWAWSDVLGYLQLVFMVGGAVASGGGRRPRMAGDWPAGNRRVGHALARRVQGPPVS